jgi:DNA (cytosine-5)-methyltransferase 1
VLQFTTASGKGWCRVKDARPVLLDLFSCAGGAAVGYHRAGFDVVGVDIHPQPRYPFRFVQADAMQALEAWDLSRFAAIHASPPCQDHSRSYKPHEHGTGWMLASTRDLLKKSGVPWVIENVPGAPMRADYRLCGCMFGLPQLRRERWFETSWRAFDLRPPCWHTGHAITVTGSGGGTRNSKQQFGRWPDKEDWATAMGIDWMTLAELAQAIPPAYTDHIGRQLMEQLALEGVA